MFKAMIAFQLLTLIYHQITTRFNLYPFNGVKHYSIQERRKEALINGIIMMLAIFLSSFSNATGLVIAASIWTLILVGAIFNWWIPYFFGKEII